ncbi:MAG: hypothetical protein AMXMBFR34_10260 [Myxococcaceae bacterium]
MSIAIGRIQGGQVVLEGDGEALPEGCRVTVIFEDDATGFHLDEESQDALVEAVREIEQGEYVTHQELFKKLRQRR